MSPTFFHQFSFQLIVLGIFILCLAIQLFYYLYFYSRPGFSKPGTKKAGSSPVSVIICAKDEAKNLRDFLPSILSQEYLEYEVIVVNDCSEDDTQNVLEEFQKKYKHLRISTIKKDPKFTHSKKFALFIGIKAAKYEWLLLTDADCYAESTGWLSAMQKNFTGKTDIVLGYGGYQRGKGLLNKYIRYETTFIAMQYLGFALAGIPYMGVGRNLAYRKSLFFKNKGFSSHSNLISGDDDLFVNMLARKGNSKTEYSIQSHIRSVPKTSFSEWIKQKKRHLSTGLHYKRRDKVLLAGEVFSREFFYLSFLFLLATQTLIPWIAGAFLLRWICQMIVFKFALIRLEEKHLLLSSLIFDFASPLLNFGIFITNLSMQHRPSWK
jgi:glycosyltransferase involved in cell wall biosynthesis